MPIVTEQTRYSRLEEDHFSIAAESFAALTIDPVWNIFLSALPFLGALFTERQELREDDPLLKISYQTKEIERINSSVQLLVNKACIGRKVTVYISDEYICSSVGGDYSLTAPTISIPSAFFTKKTEPKFDEGISAEKRNVAIEPSDKNRLLLDSLKEDDLKAIGHIISQEPLENELNPVDRVEIIQRRSDVNVFLQKMKNDSISRDDIKSLEAEIPRELESVIDRQNWILDAIKNKIIANVSLKNESAKAQLVPLQVEEVDSPNSFKFTNDEVLFFIAREIINIKSNASFLRIITKVSYVATICFILQASISLSLGLVFMAASISLYLIVERACRANFDLDAVSLLEEYYKDAPDNGNLSPQERALNAGKMAIEKLIDQNTQRREKNEICRLYITEGGDNLLDLLNPLLTSRLNNLQGMA